MEIQKKRPISIEEAINLLYSNHSSSNDCEIFDIYGNYSYPTDIKMEDTNSAHGTTTVLPSLNVELQK